MYKYTFCMAPLANTSDAQVVGYGFKPNPYH